MKLKILIYSVFIFIIGILQSTVTEYITFNNIKPNLIIVLIILVAIMRTQKEGAAVGFFSGVLLDALSGQLSGVYSLLGLYLGLMLGYINKKLYYKNIFICMFLVIIFSIFYEAIVYFLNILFLKSFSQIDLKLLISIVVTEAIYNGIVSIFIYYFIKKLNNIFHEDTSFRLLNTY